MHIRNMIHLDGDSELEPVLVRSESWIGWSKLDDLVDCVPSYPTAWEIITSIPGYRLP